MNTYIHTGEHMLIAVEESRTEAEAVMKQTMTFFKWGMEPLNIAEIKGDARGLQYAQKNWKQEMFKPE